MVLPQNILAYIIEFLVGKELASKFVWHDSGWFDHPCMPELPLREFQGMPVLFWKGDEPDFVASAYFLMSRYEELLNPERDVHGRFPGKASIPYKAGFLDRPIVDEYARYLRQHLSPSASSISPFGHSNTSPFEHARISRLYLTHDVDLPFEQRGLIGRVRDVISNLIRRHHFTLWPIVDYLLGRSDPDCFDWILDFDESIRSSFSQSHYPTSFEHSPVESIYFILARKSGSTRDNWYLEDKRWPHLLRRLCDYGVSLGLHTSYIAGGDMAQVAEDVKVFNKNVRTFEHFYNRHHFLRLTDPSDFRYLEAQGVTDDFSVGYADVAGFRVGTCRSYRWIDPRTGIVGKLIIHPMTIMECSLSDYMGLSKAEAFAYAEKLISRVAEHGGECVLLWHNPSLCRFKGNWHRELYVKCTRLVLSLMSR